MIDQRCLAAGVRVSMVLGMMAICHSWTSSCPSISGLPGSVILVSLYEKILSECVSVPSSGILSQARCSHTRLRWKHGIAPWAQALMRTPV